MTLIVGVQGADAVCRMDRGVSFTTNGSPVLQVPRLVTRRRGPAMYKPPGRAAVEVTEVLVCLPRNTTHGALPVSPMLCSASYLQVVLPATTLMVSL